MTTRDCDAGDRRLRIDRRRTTTAPSRPFVLRPSVARLSARRRQRFYRRLAPLHPAQHSSRLTPGHAARKKNLRRRMLHGDSRPVIIHLDYGRTTSRMHTTAIVSRALARVRSVSYIYCETGLQLSLPSPTVGNRGPAPVNLRLKMTAMPPPRNGCLMRPASENSSGPMRRATAMAAAAEAAGKTGRRDDGALKQRLYIGRRSRRHSAAPSCRCDGQDSI